MIFQIVSMEEVNIETLGVGFSNDICTYFYHLQYLFVIEQVNLQRVASIDF